MKYGLMYYKDTDNIGDDIQTYAAKRFLPHIDYYIDRENLNCFIPKEKEYVSMIMNGWYIHNKCAWPPSPYINPLYLSMHFMSVEKTDVGNKYLQGLGGDSLKKYQPIGARDIETKKRLEKNGIESYFSGCMTLTLQRFEKVEKTNKIYLVDAEESIVKKVKEQNTEFELEEISHWLKPEEVSQKSIEERMQDVEILLKKYQGAHLVITNRLHVALPCIALGTPVILVHRKYYDEDRLGTFLKYMDNYTDLEFCKMDIKELLENPRPNSDKYKEIAEPLVEKCNQFIQECEKNELDSTNLPEPKEYYDMYISKLKWYKDIYEAERQALERTEERRVREYNEKQKEVETLSTELGRVKKEYELLQQEVINLQKEKKAAEEKNQNLGQELNLIYTSKGWKCLEKLRKILNKN